MRDEMLITMTIIATYDATVAVTANTTMVTSSSSTISACYNWWH